MASWPSSIDNQERTRRLIDLFLVSVLLDAGAGTKWQYRSKESGKIYRRSEGLAVASLEMFKSGLFSSDPNEPCQVDSAGLKRLDLKTMARGLQVTDDNLIDGLQGRTGLLQRLGDALQNQEVFGLEARPGNMLGTPLRFLENFLSQNVWLISVQTIFFRIQQHRHLPCPSFHYPLSGTRSWTVCLRSGRRRARKSTACLSVTHGRVR